MATSSLPPRSLVHTKHGLDYYSVVKLERKSSLALHGVEARASGCLPTLAATSRPVNVQTKTTLCGGSLGSCVDEERSQLRELM